MYWKGSDASAFAVAATSGTLAKPPRQTLLSLLERRREAISTNDRKQEKKEKPPSKALRGERRQ
jgi:hypothetical protein